MFTRTGTPPQYISCPQCGQCAWTSYVRTVVNGADDWTECASMILARRNAAQHREVLRVTRQIQLVTVCQACGEAIS